MQPSSPDPPRRRRPRYRGTHPRRFDERYKEHDPERYPETVAAVVAAGRTPAGSHRPVLLHEVIERLAPRSGEVAVDCTLGHGGHASAILERLPPDGRLLGLDLDPFELPKTVARLAGLGYRPPLFTARRCSFAGLAGVLAAEGIAGADCILADLGVSSMQLDDPSRGFSVKLDGPLDMRMNPGHGRPASELIAASRPAELARLLFENADEPAALRLAERIAGRRFATTGELAAAVVQALPGRPAEERAATLRRLFQAVRIAVNDEFSALDALLDALPGCLNPGGRAVVISFHSGEDRRVKKAFRNGLQAGIYAEIAAGVARATPAERRDNPRSVPAKLRWAVRT